MQFNKKSSRYQISNSFVKLLQLKPKIRTRMDPSYLAAQLKELYKNKSEADVTVKCQGETLKAHSFLLAMRFVVLVM